VSRHHELRRWMTAVFAGVGTMGQFGFFDADRRLAAITTKGTPS